jgi:hypothetical protein
MAGKKDFIGDLEWQAEELLNRARFDLDQELAKARESGRKDGESIFSWLERVGSSTLDSGESFENVVAGKFGRYHVECEFLRLAASSADLKGIPAIELESDCGNFKLAFHDAGDSVLVRVELLGFVDESIFDSTFSLLDAQGKVLGEPFQFSEAGDVEIEVGGITSGTVSLDKLTLVRLEE